VIIGDFDIMGIARVPPENDAPLVVNTNTMFFLLVALERLAPVPRWGQEVAELCGSVEKIKVSSR